MQTEQIERVLVDLVETLQDGRKGFTSAAEKMADAGEPEIAATMREYAGQRQRFSVELRSLAAREGLEVSETGSLVGAAHRGWMSVADALSSDSSDEANAVLSVATTGEEHAKSEYARALESDLPEHIAQVIRRQAMAVATAAGDVARLGERTDR